MKLEEPEEKKPRARNARPKIERAALQLFVDEGVDAATTREIAHAAGVSEGALYRHYKGKDELALALFMDIHDRLGSALYTAFTEGGGSMETRVQRAVAAYCQIADEDWLLFSLHLLSMNKFLPHDVRREDDPVSLVEQMIDALVVEGAIPACNTPVMAGMVLGVMTQTAQNMAYNRFEGPFGLYADDFTKAILAILKQD